MKGEFYIEDRRGFNQMIDLATAMDYSLVTNTSTIGNITFTRIDLLSIISGLYFMSLYEYVVDDNGTITEKFWYDFDKEKHHVV